MEGRKEEHAKSSCVFTFEWPFSVGFSLRPYDLRIHKIQKLTHEEEQAASRDHRVSQIHA